MRGKTITQAAATMGSKQLLSAAACHGVWTGHDHKADFHGLLMNWLVVMDGKGNRRPQMHWQVR